MTEDVRLYSNEIKRFFSHLNREDNFRILFSAPFGVGKTTFLKSISEPVQQTNHASGSSYRFFHLNPVNYSIASNEDVFRALKYDLIYSLLEQGVTFNQEDFEFSDVALAYIKENPTKVFGPLFAYTSKTGKKVFDIYEHLAKLKSVIEKLTETAKNDEGKILSDYIDQARNESGGLFEFDIYTETITKILQRIKAESKKKNVLVIDDLDRIDPEHIFRLLNVFSSHLGNKFSFDKVIFVCDVNNIKHIYHHFYGEKTDFYGYLDKFYSTHIFNFSNEFVLTSWIDERLKKLPNPGVFDQGDKDSLFDLLFYLINNGFVNFRSILKTDTSLMVEELNTLYRENRKKYIQCALLKICIVLKHMIGDSTALQDLVGNVARFHYSSENKSVITDEERTRMFHLYYLAPILYSESHKWKVNEQFFVKDVTYVLKGSRSIYYTESQNFSNITIKELESSFWNDFSKCLNVLEHNHLL
jgi:hypothetical protein